jgi:hypothetical protein
MRDRILWSDRFDNRQKRADAVDIGQLIIVYYAVDSSDGCETAGFCKSAR